MCGPYWSQWDKSDLDSWQGKDIEEDEEEIDDDIEPEIEHGCSCGYHCMDCLGMSWRDFM